MNTKWNIFSLGFSKLCYLFIFTTAGGFRRIIFQQHLFLCKINIYLCSFLAQVQHFLNV